jgi:hypothetical protein
VKLKVRFGDHDLAGQYIEYEGAPHPIKWRFVDIEFTPEQIESLKEKQLGTQNNGYIMREHREILGIEE